MLPTARELNIASIKKEVDKLNAIFFRKIKYIAILTTIIYIYCLLFTDSLKFPTFIISNYIPSINTLASGTDIGMLPAGFFSVNSLLIPPYIFWIMLGDRMGIRLRYVAILKNRGIFSNYIYYVFLTTIGAAAFYTLFYEASIPMESILKSKGGWLANLMLNTNIGLYIIGGSLIIMLSGFGFVYASLILLPIIEIKSRIFKDY